MLLEFRNIEKSYDKKEVLKGISFSAESGRPLAFLGRNGAGKTTTIRILMNVIRRDGGEILLDGQPFRAADHKIGYLPEERGMYQKIRILEQLTYFAELKGCSPHAAKKTARELIARVGLSEYENRKLEVLSKGNQQKIQLVQSLLGDPEIIIMDEPFSGLDPINATLLKELIVEAGAKNRLMLFSSHQMGYVDEICSDLAILNEGRVVVNGSIEELKTRLAGNKVYVCARNLDVATLAEKLSAMSYIASVDGERVVVDLSEKSSGELLKDLVQAGVDVESYGLLKPTLADIFVEYAR